MSRTAWLLAGLAALAPASARAGTEPPTTTAAAVELDAGPNAAEPGPARPVARPRPTRLELGLLVGDYVFAVGSATQLSYAPTLDLSLAYGLAKISGLGFVRLAAPINLPGSIAAQTRQLATAGGLGLRSLFVDRARVRFGMALIASLERLDSRVRLGPLPGLDEPEHVMRRATHHAGLGLANELGVILPKRRGPTTILTIGSSLSFVFPVAASRSGSDVAPTRYGADELGIIAGLGGATILVHVGVVLGWELPGRGRAAQRGDREPDGDARDPELP